MDRAQGPLQVFMNLVCRRMLKHAYKRDKSRLGSTAGHVQLCAGPHAVCLNRCHSTSSRHPLRQITFVTSIISPDLQEGKPPLPAAGDNVLRDARFGTPVASVYTTEDGQCHDEMWVLFISNFVFAETVTSNATSLAHRLENCRVWSISSPESSMDDHFTIVICVAACRNRNLAQIIFYLFMKGK